jgi:hypothetical protein
MRKVNWLLSLARRFGAERVDRPATALELGSTSRASAKCSWRFTHSDDSSATLASHWCQLLPCGCLSGSTGGLVQTHITLPSPGER